MYLILLENIISTSTVVEIKSNEWFFVLMKSKIVKFTTHVLGAQALGLIQYGHIVKLHLIIEN